jgi:Skp family chaperone for outer membrane proteins
MEHTMHSTRRPNTTIILAAITLIAAIVWHADATAQRPPAQPTAVATIDIVSIINGLDERQVREDELNARREARQAQLDEIVAQMKKLEEDIQILNPGTDEHRDKIREVLELRAVAEARRNALAQIISIDMGSVMRNLYTKVEDAIRRIAEREGYDIVYMDDSALPLPENAPDNDIYRAIITKSVIYRHDSIDITDQVITLMNNEFSAP